MKNKHLGIVIDPELHFKLKFIATYEGRSTNSQILLLIRRYIREFEEENGIDLSKIYEEEQKEQQIH